MLQVVLKHRVSFKPHLTVRCHLPFTMLSCGPAEVRKALLPVLKRCNQLSVTSGPGPLKLFGLTHLKLLVITVCTSSPQPVQLPNLTPVLLCHSATHLRLGKAAAMRVEDGIALITVPPCCTHQYSSLKEFKPRVPQQLCIGIEAYSWLQHTPAAAAFGDSNFDCLGSCKYDSMPVAVLPCTA